MKKSVTLEVQNVKIPVGAKTNNPKKKTQCERYGHEFIATWAKKKDWKYKCRFCGLQVKLVPS
jgi:hypothetical protein